MLRKSELWRGLNRGSLMISLGVLQGCARFSEILQNFDERQILWSLCLAVFLALTLKLPI